MARFLPWTLTDQPAGLPSSPAPPAGIGAATVRELCRQGYAVTALDVCSGGNVLPGVGYPMANRANLEAVAQEFPNGC